MFVAGIVLCSIFAQALSAGILYPRHSESREILSLDGLWKFSLTNESIVSNENPHILNVGAITSTDIKFMPVPSSYNDIGTDSDLRDHVGPVWYQRKFFVPKSWEGQKVWIRFSSVSYAGYIWINDEYVLSHIIGHLPFQEEVSSVLNFGLENSITVVVNNTLHSTSVPQGSTSTLSSGRVKLSYTFDFYHYAGIDRSVVLYTTPATYIDDITISTEVDGENGVVNYEVAVEGSDSVTPKISLLDKSGTEVATDSALNGSLSVESANFWWPYLMDTNPGYLYKFQVQLLDDSGNLVDKYTLPIGIRQIAWNTTTVTINNKPLYLRGFGRHEDSDIRGKGLDLPLIIKDYNLIKWIGANAYRTSHYPYAEEIMDLADELGIMIIDECSSVNTDTFSDNLLTNHKRAITELHHRDKNRPAVIIWSASNEPRTEKEASKEYFKNIVAHVKSLDKSRPVTVVNDRFPDKDHSGEFLDIASVNIYYGWYHDAGDVDVIEKNLKDLLRSWNKKHNIPVLLTEYGADTLEGLHLLPVYIWSEEYQNVVMTKYFQALDTLRQEGFLIGEMIWNFADFKTAQTYTRVGGNKKGIFTRSRQPKSAAHLMRKRYWALAQNLDGADVPDDLDDYIFSNNSTKTYFFDKRTTQKNIN